MLRTSIVYSNKNKLIDHDQLQLVQLFGLEIDLQWLSNYNFTPGLVAHCPAAADITEAISGAIVLVSCLAAALHVLWVFDSLLSLGLA